MIEFWIHFLSRIFLINHLISFTFVHYKFHAQYLWYVIRMRLLLLFFASIFQLHILILIQFTPTIRRANTKWFFQTKQATNTSLRSCLMAIVMISALCTLCMYKQERRTSINTISWMCFFFSFQNDLYHRNGIVASFLFVCLQRLRMVLRIASAF